MSDLQFLSGRSRPVLFLKATIKKQVWVPGFTRHDGVVVAAHYAMVHVSADHDEHKILTGQGSHSQKAAHAALTKHEWFNALPHDHKIAVLQQHATSIQDKASAAAVLSTFRKKILAGAAPTPAEWKAYHAASPEKKAAIDKEAQGVSAAVHTALVQGYEKWKGTQPVAPKLAESPPVSSSPLAEWKAFASKHFGDVHEHADVSPFLGDKAQAGPAALSAFSNGAFSEINGNPDDPVSKVLLNYVAKLPDTNAKKLHRVLAFESGAKAAQFVDSMTSGGDPSVQKRTLSSWTENDPTAPGQTPMNNIALDLASQFGDHRVFLQLDGKSSGKDISFAYSKDGGGKSGTEVVLAAGVKLDVVSVKKLGDDTHVLVREVHDGDTKQAADGGTLVLKDGHWIKSGGASATPTVSAYKVVGKPKDAGEGALWSISADPAKVAGALGLPSSALDASADSGYSATHYVQGPGGHIYSVYGSQGDVSVRPLQFGGKKPVPDDATTAFAKQLAADSGGTFALPHHLNVSKPASAAAAPIDHLANLPNVHKLAAITEKIAAAKLPESNSNHKPVNAKLDALAAAVKKGDAQTILMHGYGSNTYAHKTVKLANEALAALGSQHVVVAGQKMGQHAALKETPTVEPKAAIVPSAPKVVSAVEKPVKTPTVKVEPVKHEPTAGLPGHLIPKIPSGTLAKQCAQMIDYAAAGKLEQLKQLVVQNANKPNTSKFGKNLVAMLETHQNGPAVATGPKDGDIKPGAHGGTLVFKNGRWHVQVDPAMGGWTYDPHDPGLLGAPAISKDVDGGVLSICKTPEGYQVILDNGSGDEPEFGDYASLQDAADFVVNSKGYQVAIAALKKLDPSCVPAPKKAPAPAETVTASKFVNTTPGHSKFWQVSVQGNKLVTTYGKIGTKGTSTVKPFATPAHAAAAKAKLINEKLGKGYQGVGNVKVPTLLDDGSAAAAPKVVSAAVKPPPPPSTPNEITSAETIDGWKKTGDQKGYNEGGFYTDPDGGQWYCKFPAGGEKVAKNELLASKLYALAGVDTASVKLIVQGGKVGLASKIVPGAKPDKAALLAGKAPGILSGFAVDAWLANWDTVGNNPAAGKGFDNILIKPDGTAVRIDSGGALSYGGAGGKKQTFTDKVIELKTMLDPAKNANTAAVFGKLSVSDIAASVAKVAAIPDGTIVDYCEQFGPGDAAEKKALAAKLIARKADMVAQHPQAAPSAKAKAKKKVIKFDPSKLGAAPDFLNWKGPEQSGPASLHAKNVANQEGVNKLLAVAQAGNIQKIKDLKLPFYAADGSISHQVSVLEHPSQYVRGFAQQLINEIDAQLNPPVPFRWTGDSPLAAMDKAYPKVNFKAGAAVAKLAKFIKVGSPGVLTSADAGLTAHKICWQNGSLTNSTFAAAAQKVTAKLPKQQKDALKSYTGSGYHEINKSLWTGNPSGAAKSAGEALLTLGHEIPAGTLLSRKITLQDQDLEDLKKAAGSILQEPAVMSTSIRPSSWEGSVHFKMTVGPGVKGLYVGPGSMSGGGALSNNPSEDELVLPPNTRLLVQSVKPSGGKKDLDGFGGHSSWIAEVLILPTT
jgi:predicted DNA-binding WGR domain protein